MRIGFAVVLTLLIGESAWADNLAERQKLIERMKQGYAEAAQANNVPNLIELLHNRFPDDLNALADQFIPDENGRSRIDIRAAPQKVVGLFVQIQSRDGDLIKTAPAASLKAVLEAQRGVVQAAVQENPRMCVKLVTGTEAEPSPSPEIARWSLLRLIAIFNAIADGRDKPVSSREAAEADWDALGQDALKRGYDVKSWSLLAPKEARPSRAPAVCAAVLSSLDALLTTDGALGERLLASQVLSSLTRDPAMYRKAIQR